MARTARLKADNAIFHIMCKSISEVNLFNDDEDKKKYLSLVKKYKNFSKLKFTGIVLWILIHIS